MSLMTNPVVGWLQHQLLAHLPKVLVSQMVKLESTLTTEDRVRVTEDILANRDKVELLRKFMMDMPPYDLLRAGFENDMSRFAAIVRLPLEAVKCPTLVSHGTHDDHVPFTHGETSAREIEGAQLHRVEKGWHLLALGDGADEVRQVQLDFLRKHAASA
jgi:pimeloyl-ACP methyl ester carboxylesterase